MDKAAYTLLIIFSIIFTFWVGAKFKTDGKFGVSEILCNLHDLDDIRHCWQVLKSLDLGVPPQKIGISLQLRQ